MVVVVVVRGGEVEGDRQHLMEHGIRFSLSPSSHCRQARREGRVRGGAVTEEEKGSIKEERERERVESRELE